MKIRITLATLAVALSSSAVSADDDVSCVWRVTSETNTIYFAGAFPFLTEDDVPLPAPYRKAYEDSSRVVFEVDPKESKDEAKGQEVIRMGMFTDGGSIEDAVSEATYEALGDFLADTGAPRAAMDQFRPWFASIMLSMTEIIKHGGRPDLGVGEIIEDWALKDGKSTSGLESMDIELNLIKGLPKKAQEHMLKTTLDEIGDADKMKKEYREYVKAWRAGDVKSLEKLDANENTKWDRLLEKKLVRERGSEWLNKFEKRLSGDDKTLYVLGLGQLMGKGNLLEKLRAKGYEVEQLKAKPAAEKKDGDEKNDKKKPALIPVLVHRLLVSV